MAMMHPAISQQITFLYTHDLVETAKFYEQIMALPLKLDQKTCRIYQVSQDGYVGFCQRDKAPGAPSETDTRNLILTLVVPSVDEWADYLSSHGIALESPPTLNLRYNIYHCLLRDPNGYLIEIQNFLHPF